jgi:hypothetical protein
MARQHRTEALRGIDGGALMGFAHAVAQLLTGLHMLLKVASDIPCLPIM